MNFNKFDNDSKSYRRGLVLGFTIAEIVLLILFALLLALAAMLLKNRNEVLRANAINNRFELAIKAMKLDSPNDFKVELEKAINHEIDYERKIKEIKNKLEKNSLPDDVYEQIEMQNIDLKSKEGKEKFLNMVIAALAANKKISDSSKFSSEEVANLCKAGAELKNNFDENESVNQIILNIKKSKNKEKELVQAVDDLKAKSEHWRGEAEKCGLGGVLPPCYKQFSDEPIPYIYDARIKHDGIYLKVTVPDKYRDRFTNDFSNPPEEDKAYSYENFILSTNQFLQWGKKNECRFYVRVFDDLPNDKDKFKSYLKAIESNFYKKPTW